MVCCGDLIEPCWQCSEDQCRVRICQIIAEHLKFFNQQEGKSVWESPWELYFGSAASANIVKLPVSNC